MSNAARGILQLTGLSGGRFRSNTVFSIRVERILGGGRYLLRWGGRLVTARSELSLKTGEILKGRSEHVHGAWRFKVLNRGLPVEVFRGVPSHSPETILAHSFLRAGLSLPSTLEMKKLTALFNRSRIKGTPLRLGRLLAELAAKGFDPSVDYVETLDALLDPGGGRGERPPKRWRRPPTKKALVEEVAEEAAELPDELVLFNAAPGTQGRWAVLPFHCFIAHREFKAVLKVRVEGRPALCFSVNDGTRRWEFYLEGLNPMLLEVGEVEGRPVSEVLWSQFRRSLASNNFHLNIQFRDTGDGFTSFSPVSVEA